MKSAVSRKHDFSARIQYWVDSALVRAIELRKADLVQAAANNQFITAALLAQELVVIENRLAELRSAPPLAARVKRV